MLDQELCLDCGEEHKNCKCEQVVRAHTRQKILISGYWLDDKTEFSNYVGVVNDVSVQEDDDEIFYYFDSWADVDAFAVKEGRTDTEFVITSIKPYQRG